MNYSKSGWKSLIKKTRRAIKKIVKSGELPTSYKETMISIHEGWGDRLFWVSMKQMVNENTAIYYWNAIDRTYDIDGNVIMQDEKRRMYIKTWIELLKLAFMLLSFAYYLVSLLLIF